MWRLWNKLFGWHYVELIDIFSGTETKHCYFDEGAPYLINSDRRACYLNKDGSTTEYGRSRKWEPLTFKISEIIRFHRH